MRWKVLAALAAVVLVVGCSGARTDGTAKKDADQPEVSKIEIEGDQDLDVNQLAIDALTDLQAFWGKQYPKLYQDDFAPLDGGFYGLTADSESWPQCASGYSDVEGDAFYCQDDDSVSWDAEEFLPSLQEKYGDFVIPVVLAHVWGYAVQDRAGFADQNELTVSSVLQADCFAGAWARHARDDEVFDVSDSDLDMSLAGILDVGDNPGTTASDAEARGSGFDRASAFQDGYDNDVEKCKQYADGDPEPLQLPFTTAEDEANGGNAPYDTIASFVPPDIEDYWSQAYPELNDGAAWKPLKAPVPFDPANSPECGGQSTEAFALFYCAPDDYVAWDNVNAMPRVYREAGDYAVTTLLATQYGLAALFRMGAVPEDVKTSTLRSDCLAGAYTASVLLGNRKGTTTYSISPGDLDEGIQALLVFRGEGDVERQGNGFDRVRAFREGVTNGARPCISYQG